MQLMEEKIRSEGRILPGGILKVGNFLNQQIDTGFLGEIGAEIARLFEGEGITKIFTIESSGIAIGVACGMAMDLPCVFAKKHKTSNVDGEVYSTTVHSFTHDMDYQVVVSHDYLDAGDKVLLVDDFLASGNALSGLIDLLDQSGAELAGVAVAIEKRFQGGGDALRVAGVRVESLACIESMDERVIRFTSP